MPWPAIIAAGATLGAGAMGMSSASKANKEAKKQWRREYAAQKEFAQHGIQWRTEDAIRAGLHPLAALGAQTPSFSGGGQQVFQPDYGFIGQMGQDISGAISRKATEEQKELAGIKLAQEKALLKKLDLENIGLHQRNQANAIGTPTQAPGSLGLAKDVMPGQNLNFGTDPDLIRKQIVYSSEPGVAHGQEPLVNRKVWPLPGPGGSRRKINLLTQDSSESLENVVDAFDYALRKIDDRARMWNFYGPERNTEEAAVWREALRELRPAAEPGMIHLFNPVQGDWMEVKSYPGDTRLFFEDPYMEDQEYYHSRQRYKIERD